MLPEDFAHLFSNNLPLLLKAAGITIGLTLTGLSLGLVLGMILGVLNCDKLKSTPISQLIHLYVSVIRGTPLFVQVLIIYFALPQVLDIKLSPFTAGVMALVLNSSAYVCEIVRCGINSISKGQWEAAHVLGYHRIGSLLFIIAPQMLRNVLPALTNEMIALLKETSVLMIIGVAELTKVGRDIVARELNPMTIYLTVAGIYYVMTTTLSLMTSRLERKLTND